MLKNLFSRPIRYRIIVETDVNSIITPTYYAQKKRGNSAWKTFNWSYSEKNCLGYIEKDIAEEKLKRQKPVPPVITVLREFDADGNEIKEPEPPVDLPAWVCVLCGVKYGDYIEGHIACFHRGICGICGSVCNVTEPRDFGYLPRWKGQKND